MKATLLIGVKSVFVVLLLSLSASAIAQKTGIPTPLVASFSHFELAFGEIPDWDNPNLSTDDASEFFSFLKQQRVDGIFWLRWQLNITEGFNPQRDMIYWVHNGMAAYELYWDDKLVGLNGKVAATKSEENPGVIDSEFLLPSKWITEGIHYTSIKVSSHHRPAGYDLFKLIEIKPYTGLNRYFSVGSLLPTLLVSISLMIGLYFFTLYVSERDNKAHLVFSLLCADLFVFGLSLQWPHMVGYTYDWYVVNNYIAYVTGVLFPIMLPLFFLLKYRLQKYWPLILVLPISALGFVRLENGENLFWALGIAMSVVISAWEVKRQRGKYWWELIGLLICLVGVLSTETDLEDFFYFFPLLVIFILISNAIEAQRQKQASFRYQLKSSQLEAQLLRKNIQPHFILNSLASLMEWVETAPDKSVEFISALADEFRLFAEVSGKNFIAIDKEAELCRQHLAIMTFRLQRAFTLQCIGFGHSDELPPGVLHTLIENAFSHNDYAHADVEFLFEKRVQGDQVLLQFQAPFRGHQSSKYSHLGTGTGSNYIHSQMTQGFSNHWQMIETQQSDVWITELVIDKSAYVAQRSE